MVTVGVIGAGYWGKNLVRTFHTLPSARLKYIADRASGTLSSFSAYDDVEKTVDFQDVIRDDTVDAVVVSTPPAAHYDIAKAALLAGKHVLVEKPITIRVDHAEELVELAEKNGRKLMAGHLLLYHPCVTTMKRLIDDGEIGDIYYLYCQRLNLGKVRSNENSLQSFAPHDISVAAYLIGGVPESVCAFGHGYLQKDIEDVAFLNLSFPGGRMAHIHVSWLDPHKVRRTTVVGSRKMMVFDDMEPHEKIRIYDKGVNINGEYGSYGDYLSLRDGNINIPLVKMSEPLRCECEHFIECIVNDLTPKTDGRNGLLVTRVLDAAQRSLKDGGIPTAVHA
ncbi:MAG: Gfo/Idh/MocA family oxidoreductase [Candidatus Latescibacteria bacterium]|nr:Gfo/Idh/MocA family oxidoreductase [Candidatus Latescibacterota bacterium]